MHDITCLESNLFAKEFITGKTRFLRSSLQLAFRSSRVRACSARKRSMDQLLIVMISDFQSQTPVESIT